MKLLTSILVLAIAGCSDHKPPAISASAPAEVSHTGSGANMTAAVNMNVVGTRPGRPPLERLLVDVQLRNEAHDARWVLVPSKLPSSAGGVDKLEQLTAKAGTAEFAVGRFLGTGGRYALRLAPGARVTLRKLEIGWWHDDKDTPPTCQVQLASEITLGGQPMATWFDKDPTISGSADLDMEAAVHSASHRTADDKEVPIAVTGGTSTEIMLKPPTGG